MLRVPSEFSTAEEKLNSNRAELAEGGGYAVAGTAVPRGEYLNEDLEWGLSQRGFFSICGVGLRCIRWKN